jgi:Nif-specific regulatory protein
MGPPDPRENPSDRELDPEELLAEATEAVEADERRELLAAASGSEEKIRALEAGRRRLLLLLDIARGLNRVGRVQDLLDQILVSAIEISSADRAYLLQQSDEGTLSIVASRGFDGNPGDPEDLAEISHTILERVLEQGKTLYVSDAMNNPDFRSQRSVRELSLRTVVAVPLSGPVGVTGALYVDSRSVAGLLEEEGVEILEAFGAQAALALETAAHREQLEETAKSLETVNRTLKHALGERTRFSQIIGKSPAMDRVFQVLDRVVDNSVTVLLQGETGTGKELVAQALHFNGPRQEGDFIPVNCGAIPEQLLESELFGYRKGAFTGADRDHVGLVETASGGTLFLDEIGELSQPLQVKLLRMLQEGEVRRIGESTPRKVDVRIVAATHRDLMEEVQAERFREDLYYRINVVTVTLPPLRERGEDILVLAQNFLEKMREDLNRPELQFGREVRRLLMSYSWPGNVREMMNAVERACALARTDRIKPEDLLPGMSEKPAGTSISVKRQGTLKRTLQRSEGLAILDALKESDGNISQAARLLGVSRQHLHTRIKKLELRDKK